MDGTRAEELVERYADAILRIGYTWLGDMDDAKDICQTVLIKLVEEGRRFPDLGQERAWVVRLSVNACKNWKKSAWFRRRAPLEEGLHLAAEVPEPEDGALLALEARRPAPRRQIPLRRVAALAACAGLVLGLMNYRAVAAGVGELCRYFAGIGTTADDKAELWVLEEPVTWTEGDWTYEADATLRSGVLELELTMSSRLPADQLPSPVELRLGLSADGEPLHNAVHTITPYSVADAGEGSGYPRYRLEQGYQTTASTRLRCTMAAPPPEDCALHVSGLGVQGGVFSLRLVPAETPPTVQKTWTLPQGDMTIWVAEDGSAISASFDSTEWWGWPFDISFIGASGERYPCHDITGAYELDGTERFEAIKPEGMEEPVDAVCIGGVAVERIQDAGGRADHLYESLDWVIELP